MTQLDPRLAPIPAHRDDFIVGQWKFTDTTATVDCITAAAKAKFGGAISVQVLLSALPKFLATIQAQGYAVRII